MKNTKILVLAGAAVIVSGFVFMGVASAQTHGFGGHSGGSMPGMMGQFPGVVGKVTAVSGTTIDVQSMMRNSSTTTNYSVDASNATVRKDNVTSTISAIAVGDMVMVRGTVSGASVTATSISDGQFMRGMGGPGGPWNGSSSMRQFHSASGTMPFAASSTPSISGTIASVSGTTLTVTGTDGTTYTVDISNASLIKQGSPTNTISAINVGDTVQVQGTINGTSVTATVVLDNVASGKTQGSAGSGFLGAIRTFFSNLFHFRF